MLRRAAIYFVVIASVLLTFSCARLLEEPTPEKGAVAKEATPNVDSIPTQWGNLISVITVAEHPSWVQLWFQDDKGHVRMVPYSIRSNKFAKEFFLFHRK